MSDAIYVDRDNMVRRMGLVVDEVDRLDAALASLPPAADGGAASALIGFIAGAAAEAANEYAGAVRLVGAVTESVLDDVQATEDQMQSEISRLEEGLAD
ncbi:MULTISPECIES: hypothetical protein [Microbacterium]|jgi:hypothetical protein|uniref:Excreted virulence factor EspC, type VII ESX diderm n=1 Tax=Microbacterium testaceum (strain StLB037) TaxID=979556 RepID=A0A1H0LG44_MICTS|nr:MULTISPECIES: hypothetical protein [Microbacterium]KQM40444.1 hypothetical protein ASE56_08935 [Microbacterium sp. Leaf203]SDO67043.1 hypothetical protein SAMN04487788_0532 [Microbacterium testaceum StLB037]